MCDQVCNYLLHYFQHFQEVILSAILMTTFNNIQLSCFANFGAPSIIFGKFIYFQSTQTTSTQRQTSNEI
jgi:hypothetical protein